jgi:hypothetical protein
VAEKEKEKCKAGKIFHTVPEILPTSLGDVVLSSAIIRHKGRSV